MVLPKRAESSDLCDITKPSKKREKWLDTVKVVVGKGLEEETFTVHEDQICKRSKFFHSACSHQKGPGEKKVVIRELDVLCFSQYMKCLYNDTVDFEALVGYELEMLKGRPTAKSLEAEKAAVLSMCKLWNHAYYLRDTKLKNDVMQGLVRMVSVQGFAIDLGTVKFVGEFVKPGTGLRSWLGDSFAPTIHHRYVKSFGNEFPPSIAVELLTKCAEIIDTLGGKNKGIPQLAQCKSYYEYDDVEIVQEGKA